MASRKIAKEVGRVERRGEPGRILPGQHRRAADILGLGEKSDLAPERRFLDQSAGRKQARPVEKLDRSLGVPLRLEHRTGEGDLTRQARVEGVQILLAEQGHRVGLMVGDVSERASRQRPLGLDDGVALQERREVGERSAAEDIDDEQIRLAPVFPGFRLGRRDRRAHGFQLIELSRIGGFVALGDLKLDPPQVVDHIGQIRRIGERCGRRNERERG